MYLADWEGRIRLLNTETGAVQTVVEGLSIPQGLTALDGRLYVSDMGNVCQLIRAMEAGNENCKPQVATAAEILQSEPSARILSYRIGDAGELDDAQMTLDGIIAWDRSHSANGLVNDGAYVYASIGHPDYRGGDETGGWITRLIAESEGITGRKELMGSIIRFRPGGDIEIYATGVRNTYGISIAPDGTIYGADNDADRGRTEAGQLEELNAIRPGEFYGWPYWGTNRAPAAAQVTEPVAVLDGFASTTAYATAEGVYVAYHSGGADALVVDLFDYETFSPQRIFRGSANYITAILEQDGLLYLSAFDGFIHIIDPSVADPPIKARRHGVFNTYAEMTEIIGQVSPPAIPPSFAVYRRENELIYVKENCDPVRDTAPVFFLHLDPVKVEDLPESRRQYGYDNYDFRFEDYGWFRNGRCVAVRPLPEYPLKALRTGQIVPGSSSFERLWQGSIEFGE